MESQSLDQSKLLRPNIFDYQDSSKYMQDLIDYYRIKNNCSIRAISESAGFSSNGYLSKILDGRKPLTSRALEKLARVIELTSEERIYLDYLRSSMGSNVSGSSSHSRFQRRPGAMGMTYFPTEMMEIAKHSFGNSNFKQGYFKRYSASVSLENLEAVKNILDECFERLKGVLNNLDQSGEETHQITLGAFPLAKKISSDPTQS